MTHPHTAGRAESLVQHYRDVRARLMTGKPVPRLVVVAAAPAPEPVERPADAVPLNMLAPCSWRFLVALAALRGDVPVRVILSPSRQQPVVKARYAAMSLVYRHTQYSMPGAGRLFGRDHTTVLHALKKTGSTGKLVELLPTSDSARRHKGQTQAVIAVVVPTPIPTPASKPANAVQRIVRAGYRQNKTKRAIAAEAGIKPGSVRVIASRLGIKRADYRPKSKFVELAGL
jgi:hypothetical protein